MAVVHPAGHGWHSFTTNWLANVFSKPTPEGPHEYETFPGNPKKGNWWERLNRLNHSIYEDERAIRAIATWMKSYSPDTAMK